jgi:hypoxanthine phosphoribosyltransferase
MPIFEIQELPHSWIFFPMINVGDKTFTPFIDEQALAERIKQLGAHISLDYADKQPLLVSILNGSFMFSSDLMKALSIPCEITFVKVSSYHHTTSTGQVKELIGLAEEVVGRHLIIVEDIVDTGLTMSEILSYLQQRQPRSVEIATLLFKPAALQQNIQPRYVGFEIANRFVVGFGLDYNGLGRNLPEVYVLHEEV